MIKRAFLFCLFLPTFLIGKIVPLSSENCDLSIDERIISQLTDSLNADAQQWAKAHDENPDVYSGGKFKYAPSNWFKILTIEDVSHSLPYNIYYFSVVYYQVGKTLIRKNVKFLKIDQIVTLTDTASTSLDFLILTSGAYNNPEYGIDNVYLNFEQVRLDDSIHAIPFETSFNNEDYNKEKQSFCSSASTFCIRDMSPRLGSTLPFLNYDMTTQIITFDESYFPDPNSFCGEVTGTFHFESGRFVQKTQEKFEPK